MDELCTGCLNTEKDILNVNVKMKKHYRELLHDTLTHELPDTLPVLCVDCSGELMKSLSFKEQAQHSFNVLKRTYKKELKKCPKIKESKEESSEIEKLKMKNENLLRLLKRLQKESESLQKREDDSVTISDSFEKEKSPSRDTTISPKPKNPDPNEALNRIKILDVRVLSEEHNLETEDVVEVREGSREQCYLEVEVDGGKVNDEEFETTDEGPGLADDDPVWETLELDIGYPELDMKAETIEVATEDESQWNGSAREQSVTPATDDLIPDFQNYSDSSGGEEVVITDHEEHEYCIRTPVVIVEDILKKNAEKCQSTQEDCSFCPHCVYLKTNGPVKKKVFKKQLKEDMVNRRFNKRQQKKWGEEREDDPEECLLTPTNGVEKRRKPQEDDSSLVAPSNGSGKKRRKRRLRCKHCDNLFQDRATLKDHIFDVVGADSSTGSVKVCDLGDVSSQEDVSIDATDEINLNPQTKEEFAVNAKSDINTNELKIVEKSKYNLITKEIEKKKELHEKQEDSNIEKLKQNILEEVLENNTENDKVEKETNDKIEKQSNFEELKKHLLDEVLEKNTNGDKVENEVTKEKELREDKQTEIEKEKSKKPNKRVSQQKQKEKTKETKRNLRKSTKEESNKEESEEIKRRKKEITTEDKQVESLVNKDLLSCNHCEKVFPSLQKLRDHILDIVLSDCNKSFDQLWQS